MPPITTNVPFNPLLPHRIANLGSLLGRIGPLPSEWAISDALVRNPVSTEGTLGCIPCNNWKVLANAWRKAMKWSEGLDCALSVMLASIVSTEMLEDQLWFKIMGPPSCGKSTLCEALSINPRYVLPKSTIRGFHSGWGQGDEDHSLLSLVSGKTLVTKDGDTLLQAPNLGQILSEARDVFDKVSRTHYRNANSKDYSGVQMTWILCGTSSLRSLDSSELGARFLDCVIMDGIDDDFENDVLWRVANRVSRNKGIASDDRAATQYEPALAEAMGLTGGYIDYLRQNATELLSQVENSQESLVSDMWLGKFVAYMRARPSKVQTETQEREFAARLVAQHTKLSNCLAVVLNRDSLDEEVMKRTKKVATDTGRGITHKIVQNIASTEDGLEAKSIVLRTGYTDSEVNQMLRYLIRIGAAQRNLLPGLNGAKTSAIKYVLTDRLKALYKKVEAA